MYTIKHAAQMTGVNVATLRAWERRYGIAVPQRSESGYRLYDAEALRALGIMNHLVQEGWSPKQAAEETRLRLGLEAGHEGGDGVDPGRQAWVGATADLLLAAERLDVAALTRVLDVTFASTSVETVIDDWLMPSMHELGLAWTSGRISVAGEHMVAHAVVRRLSAAYEAAGAVGLGPKVVIGLPPTVRHEIGLLGFAVAARRAGLATTYLGTDLPVEEWVGLAETRKPAAIVLAAGMKRDVAHLAAVVEALHPVQPDLLIAVGGALQDSAPTQCLRLGHRVGEAAQQLAARLMPR